MIIELLMATATLPNGVAKLELVENVARNAPLGPVFIRGSVSYPDYPRAAIAAEEQGVVLLRLTIDQNGKNVECTGMNATELPILTRETCQLVMKRFRYEPALDASGLPTVGVVSHRIVWSLGKDLKYEPADFVLAVQRLPNGQKSEMVGVVLATDEAGKIMDCAGSSTPKPQSPALVTAACQAVRARGRITPAELAGKPVRAIQTVSVGFVVEPKPTADPLR